MLLGWGPPLRTPTSDSCLDLSVGLKCVTRNVRNPYAWVGGVSCGTWRGEEAPPGGWGDAEGSLPLVWMYDQAQLAAQGTVLGRSCPQGHWRVGWVSGKRVAEPGTDCGDVWGSAAERPALGAGPVRGEDREPGRWGPALAQVQTGWVGVGNPGGC